MSKEKHAKPVDLAVLKARMNGAWATYDELFDAYKASSDDSDDNFMLEEAYRVYEAAKRAFIDAGGLIEETSIEEVPKETLSLAGEYAVASELCRRGYYAQLTLGNRKKTDILVDSGTRMIRIQVKTKQGERWPRITGVPKGDDDTVLVLVDYEGKSKGQRPVFYILTSVDWEHFIRHDLADDVSTGRFRVGDDSVPHYVSKKGKDSWRGIALYPSNISQHKERWDKVDDILGRRL